MRLKEANIAELPDRTERAIAKLARIARCDTVFGGARAFVLAKRLDRMRCKFSADGVVSDVYAASNMSCGAWGAYECPECGQAHLGQESALRCCADSDC